jgi:hypothetical protein
MSDKSDPGWSYITEKNAYTSTCGDCGNNFNREKADVDKNADLGKTCYPCERKGSSSSTSKDDSSKKDDDKKSS